MLDLRPYASHDVTRTDIVDDGDDNGVCWTCVTEIRKSNAVVLLMILLV